MRFKACPFIGTDNFLRCDNPVLCAKRHQAASVRTGIISKLRKGFEEVGREHMILLLYKEILLRPFWYPLI